jgi:hypothetical protein
VSAFRRTVAVRLVESLTAALSHVEGRLPARRSSAHNDRSGGGKPDTPYESVLCIPQDLGGIDARRAACREPAENIAVLAPMPSASDRAATREMTGVASRERKASIL